MSSKLMVGIVVVSAFFILFLLSIQSAYSDMCITQKNDDDFEYKICRDVDSIEDCEGQYQEDHSCGDPHGLCIRTKNTGEFCSDTTPSECLFPSSDWQDDFIVGGSDEDAPNNLCEKGCCYNSTYIFDENVYKIRCKEQHPSASFFPGSCEENIRRNETVKFIVENNSDMKIENHITIDSSFGVTVNDEGESDTNDNDLGNIEFKHPISTYDFTFYAEGYHSKTKTFEIIENGNNQFTVNLLRSEEGESSQDEGDEEQEGFACDDSDGGKNIYEKGEIKGYDSYGGNINKINNYTDKCDGDRVMEFYCEYINDSQDGLGYISMANKQCEYGCNEGACKIKGAQYIKDVSGTNFSSDNVSIHIGFVTSDGSMIRGGYTNTNTNEFVDEMSIDVPALMYVRFLSMKDANVSAQEIKIKTDVGKLNIAIPELKNTKCKKTFYVGNNGTTYWKYKEKDKCPIDLDKYHEPWEAFSEDNIAAELGGEQEEFACTDTDGGDRKFVYGEVTLEHDPQAGTAEDKCVLWDSQHSAYNRGEECEGSDPNCGLVEQGCRGEAMGASPHDCQYGCTEGACRNCSSFDVNQNENVTDELNKLNALLYLSSEYNVNLTPPLEEQTSEFLTKLRKYDFNDDDKVNMEDKSLLNYKCFSDVVCRETDDGNDPKISAKASLNEEYQDSCKNGKEYMEYMCGSPDTPIKPEDTFYLNINGVDKKFTLKSYNSNENSITLDTENGEKSVDLNNPEFEGANVDLEFNEIGNEGLFIKNKHFVLVKEGTCGSEKCSDGRCISCEDKKNEEEDFCSEECPCDLGEGTCDSDKECTSGYCDKNLFSNNKCAHDPQLISYWKFNETLSDSVGDNKGEVYQDNEEPEYVQGIKDKAINFNGNYYINVPDSEDLNVDEISIEALISIEEMGTSGIIEGISGSSLSISNKEEITFTVSTMKNQVTIYDMQVDISDYDGKWLHLVGTYDKDNEKQKLYINGEKVDEQSTSYSLAEGTGPIIGAGFRGKIEEIKVYEKPLIESQVKRSYIESCGKDDNGDGIGDDCEIKDTDSDGVPDDSDSCPNTPSEKTSKVNDEGCYVPQKKEFNYEFGRIDDINIVGDHLFASQDENISIYDISDIWDINDISSMRGSNVMAGDSIVGFVDDYAYVMDVKIEDDCKNGSICQSIKIYDVSDKSNPNLITNKEVFTSQRYNVGNAIINNGNLLFIRPIQGESKYSYRYNYSLSLQKFSLNNDHDLEKIEEKVIYEDYIKHMVSIDDIELEEGILYLISESDIFNFDFENNMKLLSDWTYEKRDQDGCVPNKIELKGDEGYVMCGSLGVNEGILGFDASDPKNLEPLDHYGDSYDDSISDDYNVEDFFITNDELFFVTYDWDYDYDSGKLFQCDLGNDYLNCSVKDRINSDGHSLGFLDKTIFIGTEDGLKVKRFMIDEQNAHCGDGDINQPSEECDDGNNEDGDGCSSDCEVENIHDNINSYSTDDNLRISSFRKLENFFSFYAYSDKNVVVSLIDKTSDEITVEEIHINGGPMNDGEFYKSRRIENSSILSNLDAEHEYVLVDHNNERKSKTFSFEDLSDKECTRDTDCRYAYRDHACNSNNKCVEGYNYLYDINISGDKVYIHYDKNYFRTTSHIVRKEDHETIGSFSGETGENWIELDNEDTGIEVGKKYRIEHGNDHYHSDWVECVSGSGGDTGTNEDPLPSQCPEAGKERCNGTWVEECIEPYLGWVKIKKCDYECDQGKCR